MLTRLYNSILYRFDIPQTVRDAAASLKREWVVHRTSLDTFPRFQVFREARGLKLHLGCGPDVRQGWVNLDVDPAWENGPEFYNYDLRRGIPLPDGSCSLIYSSHVFEHLTNEHGRALMRESLRVLERGGRFRMALPDYGVLLGIYMSGERGGWEPLREVIPDLDEMSPGAVVDRLVYEAGAHVCFYDPGRAVEVLSAVGFKGARAAEFEEGLDVGEEIRRRFSFYVEAFKP